MRSLISAFLLTCILIASGPISAQNPAQIQQPDLRSMVDSIPNENSPNNDSAATPPRSPNWPQLQNSEHNEFLGQLLDHWQMKSQSVKRYQCEFVRYDYDTNVVNWRDPRDNRLAAASFMTGEIRFAAPDKASYETDRVYSFTGPPDQPGGDAKYELVQDANVREKWICDGKSIYEFDFMNKRLYEVNIPAEMQGHGLIHSPLPFLFGASKDDILSRFWVRIITPEGAKDEYWLEAVPKKIDDARNYKKLELVIARDQLFLPVMLQIYAPNYDPQQNNLSSRVFEFKNRRVDGALTGIQNFLGIFVRPSTPIGWERVNRKALQAQQFNPELLQRPASRPGERQFK